MKSLMAVLVLVLVVSVTGCGYIVGGNVYSDGYRDGYLVGVTEKRNGFAGLSYVGELKVSFHGYGGGGIDPSKEGQTPGGSWTANFYDKKVKESCELIRGDQLVRIYYKEVDIHFTGGTKYKVEKVVALPNAGELEQLNPKVEEKQHE